MPDTIVLSKDQHRSQGPARCRRKFLRYFPGGFNDETYLAWERDYKAAAHQRWMQAVAHALTARDARYAKGKPRRYSDRSGFPAGVAAARGAASDFKTPPDMRVALEDGQGNRVRFGSPAGAGAG